MQEAQKILYIILQKIMIIEEQNIYYQVERDKQTIIHINQEVGKCI